MNKSIVIPCIALLSILSLPSLAQAGSAKARHETNKAVLRGSISTKIHSHHHPGSHLHIDLVNAQGQVLSSTARTLPVSSPRKEASRNYRKNYSVRVDSTASSRARVTYVKGSHSDCSTRSSCSSC